MACDTYIYEIDVYAFLFGFLRHGFSVTLECVLKLVLVDQADLEFTEIHLSLPPNCWD